MKINKEKDKLKRALGEKPLKMIIAGAIIVLTALAFKLIADSESRVDY